MPSLIGKGSAADVHGAVGDGGRSTRGQGIRYVHGDGYQIGMGCRIIDHHERPGIPIGKLHAIVDKGVEHLIVTNLREVHEAGAANRGRPVLADRPVICQIRRSGAAEPQRIAPYQGARAHRGKDAGFDPIRKGSQPWICLSLDVRPNVLEIPSEIRGTLHHLRSGPALAPTG